MESLGRKEFDMEAHVKLAREGPCFVCSIIEGAPGYDDHVVFYDDGDNIAFFNKFPSLLGYSLVCPKRHVEDLTTDLSEAEYLGTQAVVRKVARALKRVVPTERVYVMSLGSMTGNAHVHWHVAPLPPGVPYEKQQYNALRNEAAGVLDIDAETFAELGERLRAELS